MVHDVFTHELRRYDREGEAVSNRDYNHNKNCVVTENNEQVKCKCNWKNANRKTEKVHWVDWNKLAIYHLTFFVKKVNLVNFTFKVQYIQIAQL